MEAGNEERGVWVVGSGGAAWFPGPSLCVGVEEWVQPSTAPCRLVWIMSCPFSTRGASSLLQCPVTCRKNY